MKVFIEAKAKTVYQLSSIKLFGLPVKSHTNGNYTIKEEFETKKAAQDYLRNRAENYFEVKRDLIDAKQEIQRGRLTMDAVTGYINKVNE